MTWVSDAALARLQAVAREPELGGTKYRLLGEIGRGGMGAVYAAEDTALNREVAIKVLHAPPAAPDAAGRLLAEAQIIARLEHPDIVPIHDVGTTGDGRVFYVMKRVRGRRLDEHVRAGLGLAERLRIFQRLCDAVAFAHAQGIVHRDLKPENVMVGEFGEVLVMDWGVAKILEASRPPSEESARETQIRAPDPLAGPARGESDDTHAGPARGPRTQAGTIIGTIGYMAPEQQRGDIESVDQRSDVFALGALLRFLLSGRRPLNRPAGEVAEGAPDGAPGGPDIPRRLAAIVAKAMAPDRAHRYASAREVGAEVARFLDGLPVLAHRERPLERAWRLLVRHRVAVLLVLAYLVMRTLLLVFLRR
jgi:serine/threonine protein kinase